MRSSGEGGDELSILNLRLMRRTGLYQLLDPDAPKLFGRNRYKLAGTFVAAYLALEMAVCVESAYYSLEEPTRCVKYAMLLFATSFMLSKVYFVLRNADALWRLASVASVDFLPHCGRDRPDILAGARALSATVSNTMAAVWVGICWTIVLSPVVVSWCAPESVDGGRYRDSILNLIFPVTDAFYRDHYAVFYALESSTLACYAYALINHDCLVISIMVAVAYQLKAIGTSYGRLGRDAAAGDGLANTFLLISSQHWLDETDEIISKGRSTLDGKEDSSSDDQSSNELNSLILIIEDHQKFMKIMHEIYRLIRTNILIQLAMESMLITLQPFLIISNINRGFSLESFELMAVSMAHLAHMFLTCYLFCEINRIKDSVHFALYDSNWTDMSMDFKKLLLLTMRMNDAEKLKLKGSMNTVVNLELFTRVIHTTYKVVSVLVNQNK